MLLGIIKLVSALLVGNTFIWKPSPYTPNTALKLGELGAKIFPKGVFSVLSGEEDLGPMLTAHPGVGKISFTGSVATGKRVMQACGPTLKRVSLELGGNDAAIVCSDVDIAAVVPKVCTVVPEHILFSSARGADTGLSTPVLCPIHPRALESQRIQWRLI